MMSVKTSVLPPGLVSGPQDPAVTTHLGDPLIAQQTIARAAQKTRAQRVKAKKDQARNRATIDIPPELQTVVAAVAAQVMTSNSQMAAYLIALGLNALDQQGGINALDWALEKARSLRFEYNLKLPEIPVPFQRLANDYKSNRRAEK